MQERNSLWLTWAAMALLVAVVGALPYLLGPKIALESETRVTVFGYAAALLAMVAAVGSLASRESLRRNLESGSLDPGSRRGSFFLRRALLGIWVLCNIVGLLGFLLAYLAADPALARPYALGAAVLVVLHAPRASLVSPARSLPA